MRNNNQFTISEAKEIALDENSITESAELFMQGENWGNEDTIGTYEDWSNIIPENENDAKKLVWYNWFYEDDSFDTWAEYRDYLLDEQLRPVEIIDESDE